MFCIVCQYVISTGTISNTSIYQPQSVTAKLLIIQGHIKMRDDVLYKCVIDECTISCHSSNRIGYLLYFDINGIGITFRTFLEQFERTTFLRFES